jgi:hypothetical protein
VFGSVRCDFTTGKPPSDDHRIICLIARLVVLEAQDFELIDLPGTPRLCISDDQVRVAPGCCFRHNVRIARFSQLLD